VTHSELTTLLRKAKAKKQVVGLKTGEGQPLIGRITALSEVWVEIKHYGCAVDAIIAVNVYKPSSWKQIRNKQ